MSETIKEIINDLQRVADRKCYPEDILDGSIAQEWVDYITNLQEENEDLGEEVKELNDSAIWWTNRFNTVERDNREYRARIDKAIEYIKQYAKPFIDDYGYVLTNDKMIYSDDILEILQGSDKE